MSNFYEEALVKGYKRVTDPPADAPPKPAGASNIYLQDAAGDGFWLTHGVTDKADGITDADFDFGPDAASPDA